MIMPTDKKQRNKNRRLKSKQKRAAIRELLGGTTKTQRRGVRTAIAREMSNQGHPSWASNIMDPEIIGSGAYDFRKAFSGKNAARKRRNTVSRALDIGGRTLGALKQAQSGDYVGAFMSGSKILGQGDYTLSRNSIVEDMTASTVPVMHSSKESVRIRHREFLGDVYSPATASAFSLATYAINPGVTGTFPFLSTIAQQFQQYRFQGLAFEFKSTSALAMASGTNLAMGTVMMAAQYRANAPLFTNKLVLMNEMWSVDGRPSDCFMLPIECAPSESSLDVLYVRTGSLATANDDLKFYDLARLSLAMTGISATSQILGELWVTYDVELFKPQALEILNTSAPLYQGTTSGGLYTSPFIGLVTTYDNIGMSSGLAGTLVPNSSYQGYFGSNVTPWVTQIQNSTLPASITTNAGSIILPVGLIGTYMLVLQYTGTAATTTVVVGTDAYGTAAPGFVTQASQNNWKIVRTMSGNVGAGSTQWLISTIFTIVSSSAQTILTMHANVIPTASTGFIVLTDLNGNAA